ncbi:MAG: DUF4260 domain-containing protein [Balneolaceae bacterium]|nr:DUF4260 domain-containing protein [Balneolaceae bacterium]MBO6547497.1 DUF4260 domain-containing protein [Balneolaceae bacterium]MBO6647556.1 DUF4260 domain-containing protein [Balneolaceae bacterium]
MERTLKLEELAMFGFSIFLFNQTEYAWWVYLALILAPDIGMIGYAINAKIGALTYNLFHHKGIALSILILGYYYSLEWLVLTGIILFGHAALDRMLGYGLKYEDSFKHTHLGWLNRKEDPQSNT